jgi:formimidoylglutamate deiminase
MRSIFASSALLANGWVANVRVEIADGAITAITPATAARGMDTRVDILLPALANLHSHAFQRAMAGMTEYRAPGRDNFWTWRELMYRFVDQLTPDQIEAIAALVFMEMQEAGYGAVGEFHYLHHQPGGQPYGALAELGTRIFAAAELTGIGLTHLPVLYSYGGAGEKALGGGQLRFGNKIDRFNRLVDETRTAARFLPPDTGVGIAPHSLRATSPDDLARVVADHPGGPVHMHIAEQEAEITQISEWLGARPVEWLLDNCPPDRRWCLIHATHMTHEETIGLARSGAVAGLCPITEANLGDGTFNGPLFLQSGGSFGVGSDSNVRISLSGELRGLEYAQRLRDRARNLMVIDQGSVGAALYLGAAAGGAQALSRNAGAIKVGALADLVALDRKDPSLCALSNDQLLDGLVFAASDRVVTDVWSAGRHQVRGGRHVAHDRIVAGYRVAVAGLMAEL